MNKLHKTLIVLAAGSLLAACGDSPQDNVAPPAASREVPASATASVASYTQFVASTTTSSDTEALDVNKVVPPTSETDAPAAI